MTADRHPKARTDGTPEDQFFFGAMSPYSWFAAERLSAGARQIRWRPVFVGALFKAQGRVAWGLTSDRGAKIADCERRAQELGLGAINWPSRWPTNDLRIARAMTYADIKGQLQPFALNAMRACFGDGAELADAGVLADIARTSGLDGSALEGESERAAVRERLRAANAEAVAAGVVGVPTFVTSGDLYWGEDLLDEVIAVSHGTG